MTATDAASNWPEPPATPANPSQLFEELLDTALGAMRQGTLALLVRQRPLAARWLMRPFEPTLLGTAGDLFRKAVTPDDVPGILLRWLITQLRPDQEPRLDDIDDDAWLNLSSWRPMLAVMCHYRLGTVPAFPSRYRKRAEEAPVDNLCGLWDVGPSTFYRYVERGKHRMAQIAMARPPSAVRKLSLRRFVLAELAARRAWRDDTDRGRWHREQAERLRWRGDASSALWHAFQAGDPDLSVEILSAHAPALAGESETEALIARIALQPMVTSARFNLCVGRAALYRTLSAVDKELASLEQSLQLAAETKDALLLGVAYGAIGRFYESRDADRAFACYDDSAKFLLQSDPAHQDDKVRAHYMTTLVRSAWMHVLRSHPKAKSLLEQADQLHREFAVPDELVGLLEQSWGEYWRIAGDVARALEAKHRALNIFERIGDRRSVLVTYLNLITLHGETRELERAQGYARRIFDAANVNVVEPSILVSTHQNLGAAYGLCGRYGPAAIEFHRALELSKAANLRVHANRARFNLASALYKQFLESDDPALERQGDEALAELLRAPPSESLPSMIEEARNLKKEVLGVQPEKLIDRLLDEESAEHLQESTIVRQQRAILAGDASPAQQARARLTIASAYLAISVKEREAARALVESHRLGDTFLAELGQLRETFDRELTREQRLLASWKQRGADLLDDARRGVLVESLLREGSVNKSTFAQLCGVSPATASKHLTTLAQRGLLQQTGKGPSTRYLLKD